MYLVSMVAFYTTLGVEDYPFFVLVTSGKVGAILMAWKSSKHAAFHFATFLLRLRDDQKKLKDLVKSKLSAGGKNERKALRAKLREWSKLAQHLEDEARAQAEELARTAQTAEAAEAAQRPHPELSRRSRKGEE
ncbi:hypothetical protein B0H14DRAFT_2571185 [Mycena olivaceomarginata]|nr:hypothetical protein B0H14DRAFT_2571185 [Mycena olivaceomarginata]